MNNTTIQERAAEHAAKLETERADWHAQIKAEAEKLGLTHVMGKDTWGRFASVHDGDPQFACSYVVEEFSPRGSYTNVSNYNRIRVGNHRHQKRIWKKLDVAVIAAELQAHVKQNRASHDHRAAHDAMTREFNERKANELKGVYPLPGMRAEIVMGDYTADAGKYVLLIEQHNNALRGPWTLEQLKAILAALETVVPSHPFRVGRKASVQVHALGAVLNTMDARSHVLSEGIHTGVITDANDNRITLRVTNPDTTGKTLWHHEDLYVSVKNTTLKLVDDAA